MEEDTVLDELRGEFVTTYEEALKLLSSTQIQESDAAEGSSKPNITKSKRLAKLDASLTSLLGTYLASLRRRRNTHNLLSRLTDELLESIFLFAVHSEPPTASLLPVHTYSPSIRSTYESNRPALEKRHRYTRFYLSHVCSRWRRLILEDARIWSYLEYDQMPRRLAALSFERAGMAPLDVRFAPAFHNSMTVDALERLLGILTAEERTRYRQVRSLEVLLPTVSHLSAGGDFPSLAPLLTKEMPLMQSLTVRSCQPPSASDPWAVDGNDLITMTLPTLCGDRAPSLTRLNVQSFVLPWSIAEFTNLTYLILSFCSFNAPSMENDFISVLRQLPSLRQLSLVQCRSLCAPRLPPSPTPNTAPNSPTTSSFPPFDPSPASLPNLELLRLQDLTPSDTSRLLTSLITSSSLRLTLRLQFPDAVSISTFPRTTPLTLSPVLDTVQDAQITISDHGVGVHQVTLIGSRVKCGLRKNVHVEMSCSQAAAVSFESVAAVLSPFGVPGCRRLVVNYDSHLSWGGGARAGESVDDLVHILRLSPRLETLVLMYMKDVSTLEALNARQSHTDPSLVCPQLDTLEIECSSLCYDAELLAVVERRKGRLRRLMLKGSQILRNGTLEALRECVDEVLCEGEDNDIAAFDGTQITTTRVAWNNGGWGAARDGWD